MAALRHIPKATDGRRRDSAFERFAAEIARDSGDLERLRRVEARVMNHPDVRADTELAAMLRTYIAQKEAELRVAEHQLTGTNNLGGAHFQPSATELTRREPSATAIESSAARLEHEFHDHVGQFDRAGARAALERIRELVVRYPGKCDPERLPRLERQFAQFDDRLDRFRTQVHTLAAQAVAAARSGDGDRATTALRRLSAIHAARPNLVSEAEFEHVRRQLEQAAEIREHQEAARALLRRERAVAAEIKSIAADIQRFHRVARRFSHDDPAYVEAAREYAAAVAALKSHDEEWLAALILEFAELLEQLHESTGRAAAQVDRFLASVREALTKLKLRVRSEEGESQGRGTHSATPGAGRSET